MRRLIKTSMRCKLYFDVSNYDQSAKPRVIVMSTWRLLIFLQTQWKRQFCIRDLQGTILARQNYGYESCVQSGCAY